MYISFLNSDNLLFLCVVSISAIIILAFFYLFLLMIGKMIKMLFKKKFNIKSRKSQPAQNATEDFVAPKKIINENEEVFIKNSDVAEKPEEKDIVKFQNEKDQKEIAESLGNLKSKDSTGKDTLESKMPDRVEKQEDDFKKIEIPRVKKFNNTSGQNAPQDFKDVRKVTTAENMIAGIKKPDAKIVPENHARVDPLAVLEKPDFAEDTLSPHSDRKVIDVKLQQNKSNDQTIFKGEPEVSRIKLEYEMRKDPNVWKAARDARLNISPVERAKLVKEVFAPVYGRNISKADLKWSLKKLNQKLVNAKDKPAEHEKIRKEIKFFKKIGGIK